MKISKLAVSALCLTQAISLSVAAARAQQAMPYQRPSMPPNIANGFYQGPALPAPPAVQQPSNVILVTTPQVTGFRTVACKGLVQAVSVRQPTWTQNSSAGFQGYAGGGDIPAFTQMCQQGRLEACLAIINNARGMGANAVVDLRFDNSSVRIDKDNFATEIACYGTAVVIEPETR